MAHPVIHECLLQCRYYEVASTTWRTYQLGVNIYVFLLHKIQHSSTTSIFPDIAVLYAVMSQQISYIYLSGIHLMHIEHGLPDLTDDSLLQIVCCGIRHQQGDHQQRLRLPISINSLCMLKIIRILNTIATHVMGNIHFSVLWFSLDQWVHNSALVQMKNYPSDPINQRLTHFDMANQSIYTQCIHQHAHCRHFNYSKLASLKSPSTLIFSAERFSPLSHDKLNVRSYSSFSIASRPKSLQLCLSQF